MDDVYVYQVKLPPGVHEMVTPCADGYTVYIDEDLSEDAKLEAYAHAVEHITKNDWQDTDVQVIEAKRHSIEPEAPKKVRRRKPSKPKRTFTWLDLALLNRYPEIANSIGIEQKDIPKKPTAKDRMSREEFERIQEEIAFRRGLKLF